MSGPTASTTLRWCFHLFLLLFKRRHVNWPREAVALILLARARTCAFQISPPSASNASNRTSHPRTNPGTSSEQKHSSYSINTPLHLKYLPHMMTENASPRASLASDDLTSRRVRYFGAFTLLIGMFLYPKLAPSYFDTAEKSTADRINSTTGFVNSSSIPRVNTTVSSLENTTHDDKE